MTSNSFEEKHNRHFFQQRLSYYIQGAQICLSNMMGGINQHSDESFLELARQLKSSIEQLTSMNLGQQALGEKNSSQTSKTNLEKDQDINESKLSRELILRKRRNKALRKVNLRLKTKIRRLKTRIRQIKYGFAAYSKLAQAKLDQKSSLPQNANQALKDTSKDREIKAFSKPPSIPLPESQNQRKKLKPSKTQPTIISKKLHHKAVQASNELNQITLNSIKPKPEKIKTSKTTEPKQINKLILSTIVRSDLSKNQFIGGACTLLALKDQNEFMVATQKKGIVLYSNHLNNVILYSSSFNSIIKDLIYVKDINCYLMSVGNKLYRKDINKQPAYVFIENLCCGMMVGACLRYSKLNKKLIISKDGRHISVVNLYSREVEIAIKNENHGIELSQFQLTGQKEDRVVAVGNENLLVVYQIDYAQKNGLVSVMSGIPLETRGRSWEKIKSVSVCPLGEYIFVELGQLKQPFYSTRIFLMKVKRDKLIQVRVLEVYKQKLAVKPALDCYGYIGSHILWVGLSKGRSGKAYVYDFDVQTRVLREMSASRIIHGELTPVKIHRAGEEQYYYVGQNGRVRRLVLNFYSRGFLE